MTEFKLHRFAILTPEITNRLEAIKDFSLGAVGISFLPIVGATQYRRGLVATKSFVADQLNGIDDGNVVDARTKCEAALAIARDLVTGSIGCGLTMWSAWPIFVVGWDADLPTDRVGTDAQWTRSVADFRPSIQVSRFEPGAGSALLQDRLSGLGLLSQALSNAHAVGKLVGLCRVFEDAFAEQASVHNAARLANFLAGARLEYEEPEVQKWLTLRGSSAHGDLRHHKKHAIEQDAFPVLPRLQQAAYDVLFNKAVWHANSSVRRNAWFPTTAHLKDEDHIQVTVGFETSIGQHEFDPYTGWPMSTDGKVNPIGRFRRPILKTEFPRKITTANPPF